MHYLSYVGPVAQAENKDPPEDEMSSSEKIALMNKRWGLVLKALESVPRMKSSAEELENGLTAKMAIPKIRLGWTSTAEI